MTFCPNRLTLDIEEALYWKCIIKAAEHHQTIDEWIISIIETVIEDAESTTENN